MIWSFIIGFTIGLIVSSIMFLASLYVLSVKVRILKDIALVIYQRGMPGPRDIEKQLGIPHIDDLNVNDPAGPAGRAKT